MRALGVAALLMATLVAPAWACMGNDARARAEHRACLADQQTLTAALEMYFSDDPAEGERWMARIPSPGCIPFPRRLLETLLTKGYIQRIPTDHHLPEGLESRLLLGSLGRRVLCLGHAPQDEGSSARDYLSKEGIKDGSILARAATRLYPERFHDPETLSELLGQIMVWLVVLLIPACFYLDHEPSAVARRLVELVRAGMVALAASFLVCLTPAYPVALATGFYSAWCLYLAQGAIASLALRGLAGLIAPFPRVRLVLRVGRR